MKNRTLGDLGGQRLGQMNYSPSCFDVHLPWDMAANRAVLAMTMAFGCSVSTTFRKSSAVGGHVTGRGLGSSLIWSTLPHPFQAAQPETAQMSGPEEPLSL